MASMDSITSFLSLPVLGVGVEDEATAAFLPLELNLLLVQPLLVALLVGHVVVQRLVSVPLLAGITVLDHTQHAQ